RQTEFARISELISQNTVTVVYGESGSGKSALVKTVLDREFSNWRQIWLGPDQLTVALNEIDRSKLGLTHPLAHVLRASAQPDNVLVIDAAERLARDVLKDARELVATITENDAGVLSNNWHVVIVTQTEGWTEGAFQTMGGTSGPPNHEVRSISTHDVRA